MKQGLIVFLGLLAIISCGDSLRNLAQSISITVKTDSFTKEALKVCKILKDTVITLNANAAEEIKANPITSDTDLIYLTDGTNSKVPLSCSIPPVAATTDTDATCTVGEHAIANTVGFYLGPINGSTKGIANKEADTSKKTVGPANDSEPDKENQANKSFDYTALTGDSFTFPINFLTAFSSSIKAPKIKANDKELTCSAEAKILTCTITKTAFPQDADLTKKLTYKVLFEDKCSIYQETGVSITISSLMISFSKFGLVFAALLLL